MSFSRLLDKSSLLLTLPSVLSLTRCSALAADASNFSWNSSHAVSGFSKFLISRINPIAAAVFVAHSSIATPVSNNGSFSARISPARSLNKFPKLSDRVMPLASSPETNAIEDERVSHPSVAVTGKSFSMRRKSIRVAPVRADTTRSTDNSPDSANLSSVP